MSEKSYASEIENLLMDFLVYRKEKRTEDLKIASMSDIGKGWPYYTNINLEFVDEGQILPRDQEVQFPLPLESQGKHMPEADSEFMQLLYLEINKRLHPLVTRTLEEYCCDGNPLLGNIADKGHITKIVDEIFHRAHKEKPYKDYYMPKGLLNN